MMSEHPFTGCCTAKIIYGMGGSYTGYLGLSHKIMKYSDLTEAQKNHKQVVAAREGFFNSLMNLRDIKEGRYKDFADCSLLVAITTEIQDLGADCLREAGWTPAYTGTKDQPEQREKSTGGLTLWCIEPKDYIAWKKKYKEELEAAKTPKVEERKPRFSAPKEEPVAVHDEVIVNVSVERVSEIVEAIQNVQPVVEAPRRVPSFTIRNLVAGGFLPETIPGATLYRDTRLNMLGGNLWREVRDHFAVTQAQWQEGIRDRNEGLTLRTFNERMRVYQEANGGR